MRAVPLALLLLLLACADTSVQELEARLGTLIGASEAELVRRVGPPTRSVEAGGRRFLAYVDHWPDFAYAPGGFGAYGWRRGPFWGGDRMVPVERFCEITFEIAADKVAGFRYRGSSCGWGGRPPIEP